MDDSGRQVQAALAAAREALRVAEELLGRSGSTPPAAPPTPRQTTGWSSG
ncbi:MAG TPA: hypothetical protein VFJ89_04390 [Nocardioides sp.]|nr:hypothetical protein [Nocardioides sp.]